MAGLFQRVGSEGEQESWLRKKGKPAEGFWDLDQAGAEKGEHAFSGQP
ncbi:hypothetical protein T458_23665 [Brevibacillus panacihumi W25]|uniref:Uncharacterized protein n=1 Tax=Brevibacillus panacihumi W25 TaxID=1408254 RepID=V6MF18_9BACL|nr:hypothetical protein T458_23665 [Brevibacillus panacihumi W25]